MALKTLLVLLALGLGAASPQASPATPPAADVAVAQMDAAMDVLEMTWLPVTVDMVWIPCGQENAFYIPDENLIVMCLELQENPGAEAIAAHEAGHSLVTQLGLQMDPDSFAAERAADELAALALIKAGKLDELAGVAKAYMVWAAWGPGDEDGLHPKLIDRAREALCLMDGSTEDGTPACQGLYHMVKARWEAEIRDAEMHFRPAATMIPMD